MIFCVIIWQNFRILRLPIIKIYDFFLVAYWRKLFCVSECFNEIQDTFPKSFEGFHGLILRNFLTEEKTHVSSKIKKNTQMNYMSEKNKGDKIWPGFINEHSIFFKFCARFARCKSCTSMVSFLPLCPLTNSIIFKMCQLTWGWETSMWGFEKIRLSCS